jgi:hypothetical protein
LFYASKCSNKCLAECRFRIRPDFVQSTVFRDATAFQDGERAAEASDFHGIMRHKNDGEAEFSL